MKKIFKILLIYFICFNIYSLPIPYLFYFEVPLDVYVVQPNGIFVKAFTSNFNDNQKKYIWVCIYGNTTDNNEMAFLYWIRALVENSPPELNLYFEEIGNNTSSARYNFIKPILTNLGINF